MTDSQLQFQLALAFEYTYRHDDWVTPLHEALDGVTAEQALCRPPGMAKGIWDIVLHLAVWNENIIERVRTRERCRPLEGHWPAPPDVATEESWAQAKTRLTQSLTAVEHMLRTTPPDELQSGPYGLADVLCRFIHVGYHLGQITKMTES